MGTKAKPTNSPSEIRRLALLMTASCWAIGTGSVNFFGRQPLPRAAAVAAVAALGGLAVWAIYHELRRRNDGLAVFITVMAALNPPGPPRASVPSEKDLGRVVLVVAVQALFFAVLVWSAVVLGRGTSRWRDLRSGMPRSIRHHRAEPTLRL